MNLSPLVRSSMPAISVLGYYDSIVAYEERNEAVDSDTPNVISVVYVHPKLSHGTLSVSSRYFN